MRFCVGEWFRWHLFLTLLVLLAKANARPQESIQTSAEKAPSPPLIENRLRKEDGVKKSDVKNNSTEIKESIKIVASQLLQANSSPQPETSRNGGIIEDVRTPPKVKNQHVIKNKLKANPTTVKPLENSHAGVAVALSPEDLENEINLKLNKTNFVNKESSTSDEGISTWILLSGSPATTSTPPKSQVKKATEHKEVEKPKIEEVKEKPIVKPKPKTTPKSHVTTAAPKPMFTRRPIAIGSPNKADLIASGSAVNENVMNKIKASVLASVQKNKNAALNKTTTTVKTTTERPEIVVTFESKPMSSSKVKEVETVTQKIKSEAKKPVINIVTTEKTFVEKLDLEPKIAEIELEVSTPPMPTSKKPKRTSSKRKKNKNRRRKPAVTSTVQPELEPELKTVKTPSKAVSKVPPKDKPFTTQLYNYFSREVMPSVGVGLVSLAGIVGLASYFLYPFSNVVRRAYNPNDRKDDLYYRNGEAYASDDSGQSEEEMLSKVFAGMPESQDQTINPYSAQTQFRYPQPKEQNLRYRNVPYNSEMNSYVSSDRVGQHSIDGVKGIAYSERIHYDTHMSDLNDYAYQPQPVYKASEKIVESNYPVEPTAYSNDKIASNYVQPVRYNQEADSTSAPVVETLHLGSEDIIEKQKETGYTVASSDNKQPQFVVGNVPKELIQAVTPITVPEHGPRSLRIRRNAEKVQIVHARSLSDSLEEVLKAARENNTDAELSNEIDEALGVKKDYYKDKVQVVSVTPIIDKKPAVSSITSSTLPSNVVSISEIGAYLSTKKYEEMKTDEKPTIEFLPNLNEILNDTERTNDTKPEKIFIEVSTQSDVSDEQPTTEIREAETTTMPTISETEPIPVDPVYQPKNTFLNFLRALFEFKLRLGMSFLQSTSESISRYLRGMEQSLRSAADASRYTEHYRH